MRNLILLSFAIMLLVSCKSTPIYRETRIVDTVLKVQPPAINETLVAVVHDTVVTADKVRGVDTIIKIRYYPKTNVLTMYALPDTVTITKRDTVQVFTQGKSDSSERNMWIAIFVSILCVGCFLLFILRKIHL